MRRVRLTIGYRGTRYAGWAVQPAAVTHGQPTLQATLQQALAEALGHPVHAQCAGRTDAGVHADGQVVSFDTRASIPPAGLLDVLPRWLPDDVWPIDARDAEPDFDARRSAVCRWYRYAIWRGPAAPPSAWQGRCLALRQVLDLGAMRQAASGLLGQRDFRSFTSAPAPAPSARRASVRTVLAADWLALDEHLLIFEVCADAFLKHMVRSIVGSLLWVGTRHWSAEQFGAALAAADRRAAGPTAPALGLTLHRIDYPRSTSDAQYPHPIPKDL